VIKVRCGSLVISRVHPRFDIYLYVSPAYLRDQCSRWERLWIGRDGGEISKQQTDWIKTINIAAY
jgi:hypothetical protein